MTEAAISDVRAELKFVNEVIKKLLTVFEFMREGRRAGRWIPEHRFDDLSGIISEWKNRERYLGKSLRQLKEKEE